jgi:tetratricopeptide (TPR) repeat protein
MDGNTRSRPSFWPILAGIVLVALALRLIYLREFAALPIFDQPVGDSAAHLRRAGEIARGALLPSHPFYYCSIFYPYFLALVLVGFHGTLASVALIQLVAGALVVGLLATSARMAFGNGVGIATGLLAALYGPSAFFEADVLGVVWGQLGLALGILALAWWWRHRAESVTGGVPLLLAGLAFGLAVVERPNLLLCTAAAALCLFLAMRVRRVRRVALFGAGALAPLLVVLALNVAGTGQWVPLTTSGGINLSLGYHDGATGTYDEPWEREAPEFSAQHTEPEEAMTAWASIKTGRVLTPQEASKYWLGQALHWIGSHPGESALLTLRKAALMLNGVEVPNHLDFAFIRERAPALRLMPIGFSALLGLAGIGAVILGRRRRAAELVFLLLLLATALLSVVPFTVADRYRAPMFPALFILAGVGVVALLDLVRNAEARRDKGALLALGTGLLLVLVSLVPLERPLRGRDHWMFAQAYEARGRLGPAIASYEAAVREEPSNGQLLNNLGNAYRRAGDRARALGILRKAVAFEPGLAYPHKSLGLLLVDNGALDQALAELERAHAIDSTDVEVVAMMGGIHAEQGNPAAAAHEFSRARAMAPDDPRLDRLIRHYTKS